MEQLKPRGRAINRAISDDIIVPYIKGSAPKTSWSGSQALEKKKPKPNVLKPREDLIRSRSRSRSRSKGMLAAKQKVIALNQSSPFILLNLDSVNLLQYFGRDIFGERRVQKISRIFLAVGQCPF